MYFDVTIIVESQMEQMNMAYYLKNAVRMNRPFFLHLFLENHIPREIIQALAKDKNIDMDNVPELLAYLNGNSTSPVTYKMKNSTGNDEFFRHYPAEIDTIITNFQTDDGSRKNMVEDAYTISFTISTEYWAAGLFYYFTRNPKAFIDFRPGPVTGSNIIPMSTQQAYNKITVPQGWDKYISVAYKVEMSNKPYELKFDVLMNNSLASVHKHIVTNNLSFEGVFQVVIEQDGNILNEGSDYAIDYRTTTLTTIKSNEVSTYRFNLLMNTKYINDLIIDLQKFDEEK